jgi:hypothetical protein
MAAAAVAGRARTDTGGVAAPLAARDPDPVVIRREWMGEVPAVMTSPRTKTASMRLHVYEVARELGDQAYVLVGAIAGHDERFLRDQLEHKSAAVTKLVMQAAEADSVVERRALYLRARQSTVDCTAILDGLGKQGVIEAEPLNTCRTTASKLVELLAPLTVPPVRQSV